MDSGTISPAEPAAVAAFDAERDATSDSSVASTVRSPVAGTTRPLTIWVLVPFVETSDPNLAYYNDYSQSRAEYARVFAALGHAWNWTPVLLSDYERVIDKIINADDRSHAVVLNLCDGDETNGVPGLSVVRYLEAKGLCFTGADSAFYDVTTSKITMKERFDLASVPTSPWAILHDDATADDLFARCGSPLIIKPAISAGSMGITIDSVVHAREALETQRALLRDGYRGWDLTGGGVLVERFIVGAEYTTFIVGSADAADQCVVYPPVERVFNRRLPPTEQFLSFDRLWEIYERESSLGDSEYLWEYGPVLQPLAQRIMDVSWAAYAAVDGRGYGRVDLRMDADTGELFVLEVNSQCGLSEDENYTSIGAILRFAGVPFSRAVRAILDDAMRRQDSGMGVE